MSLERGKALEPVAWLGNRNFIVPPEIVPVRRVSPIRKRPRTPWRGRPEGERICRAGDREWFADQLFVAAETSELRTVCGASMTVHASCLVALLVLLAGQPAPTEPPVRVQEPLRMPAFVAMIDDAGGGGGHPAHLPRPTSMAKERAIAPSAKPRPRAASKPRAPSQAEPLVQTQPPTAPVQVATPPVSQEVESDTDGTMTRDATPARSIDGGVGLAAGAAIPSAGSGSGSGTGSGGGTGGGVDGSGGRTAGIAMSPGPYRLGKGIEPPRKIKDVRPSYPSDAMAPRTLGTVAIEAVVGVDGFVHDAKVIHSIPRLDQAALEAVRQWQFTPARLNGTAVAVIITVLVQFSIY